MRDRGRPRPSTVAVEHQTIRCAISTNAGATVARSIGARSHARSGRQPGPRPSESRKSHLRERDARYTFVAPPSGQCRPAVATPSRAPPLRGARPGLTARTHTDDTGDDPEWSIAICPPPQGLYDPRFEHDAAASASSSTCRAASSHAHRRPGAHRGVLPEPPRRGRRRGRHRRRRRHPRPDPRRASTARSSTSSCRRAGAYATGIAFLPADDVDARCVDAIEKVLADEGFAVLGWRDVPDRRRRARRERPRGDAGVPAGVRRQGRPRRRRARAPRVHRAQAHRARDRRVLPVAVGARRRLQGHAHARPARRRSTPTSHDERVESALALVHSRFSTNTFPRWPLAHPYRMLAHNGEINTRAGQRELDARPRRRAGSRRCCPATSSAPSRSARPTRPTRRASTRRSSCSTSAGRPLHHAILMMIPEAWENHESMDAPTQGVLPLPRVADGAVGRPGVDRVHRRHGHRRGARPQRPAPVALLGHRRRPRDHGERGRRARRRPRERSCKKGRLEPGRMFLVDTTQGRIIPDDEIKAELAAQQPYQEWLDAGLVHLDDLPPQFPLVPQHSSAVQQQRMFGYTQEDLRLAHRADGAQRGRVARLDGHRHAGAGALRPAAACSTTTSSSCSRRSRTRRSTPSSKSSSRR